MNKKDKTTRKSKCFLCGKMVGDIEWAYHEQHECKSKTLIDRLIEKFKNRFGYIFHKGVVPDEITKEKIESFLRKEIKELVKEAVGEEETTDIAETMYRNSIRNFLRRQILDKVCGKVTTLSDSRKEK